MRLPRSLQFFAATLLLLTQLFSPLYAETFSYPDKSPKFTLQVPPNWKTDRIKEDKEESVTFTSPSGAIKAVLKTTLGDADNAVSVLVAETEVVLKYDVKNPVLMEVGPLKFVPVVNFNNLKSATQLNAKGLSPKDDKPVLAYFIIFSQNRKLWGLFYSVYPASASKQEQDEFHKMVGSITGS